MGQLVNFCAGTNMHILPARYVGAILINVPDNGHSETAITNTKRMIKAAKSNFIMQDSGGYQLFKAELNSKKFSFDENRPVICNEKEINLAPVHGIMAAADIRPDILIGQDFPIKKTSDPDERKLEFLGKLGFNIMWAKECHELRKIHCPDIGFFQPIQCYDLAQFEQFINLIKGVQYDGFSMPIRNLSISEIILFMVRFYQIGIRQVHLLGTSKLFAIAVASYMAQHLFDWVSFDATTWSESTKYLKYLNPNNLSSRQMILDAEMDCECPFCRGKTFAFIKNLPEPEQRTFLRGHNWWVLEKATKDLHQNSANVIQLGRCLRSRSAKAKDIDELTKALSLADSLKGSDIKILQGLFQ